ncbi:hypothetical protein AURDEDRAFT_90248 [Auricularia subglabra TFB-10046 SS5]|nr:hypothetical protein AURDEDRAFT_90248 [Auricularia subglabra TFB-10046 SS5]
MISLLLSDMLQAVGALLNIHHISLGRTECSPLCTAQGALKALGETSAAMATLTITLHTFCVIFFHWTPPEGHLIPTIVITAIWLYVFLYVGLALALHRAPGAEFFQPVPFWCWVSAQYPKHRIFAEYFWLWLSAFSAVLLYVPLFFFVRGNIEVDPQRPWVITFHRFSRTRRGVTFNRVRQSVKMLLYPMVYIIVVLPLSVTRWIAFTHHRLPAVWTFVGIVPFHLSGLGNVLLLILTRPSILVFGGADSRTSRQNRTITQGTSLRFEASHGGRVDTMAISVHVEQSMYDDEDVAARHLGRLARKPSSASSDVQLVDLTGSAHGDSKSRAL